MQKGKACFAKTLASVIGLALFPLNTYAEVVKWIDEKGVVHYSDTRPSSIQADSVRNFSGKESDTTASTAPKNWAEREAELKKLRLKKQKAEEEQAKALAAQEEKQRNCASARESLRTLELGGRLVVYDENGEQRYLDDEERAKRLESAREAVKIYCN